MSLRVVPLLPPIPERGQRCFDFLRITVVVLPARTRTAQRRASRPTPRFEQRTLDWRGRAVEAPAPRRPPGLHEYRPRVAMPWARSASLGMAPLTAAERVEMEAGIAELEAEGIWQQRPRVGNGIDGDCQPGPCPWVSCKWNLYLWVDDWIGTVKIAFPGREIDELEETCALRAAASVGAGETMSIDRIGTLSNVRPEWAAALIERAAAKIKDAMRPHLDEGEPDE